MINYSLCTRSVPLSYLKYFYDSKVRQVPLYILYIFIYTVIYILYILLCKETALEGITPSH